MAIPAEKIDFAERRKGLGASEAAAACGLSPWQSPLELFLQKTGRAGPIEETLPMRVGKALEPVVLRAFTEREGLAVANPQGKFVDSANPWRWATIDGMAVGADAAPALIEAKTTASFDGWGEDGSDQIPLHYMLQVQHGLVCTGFALAFVPVLFQARELRVYRVPRSDAVIEALTEKERAFWQRVVDNEPPEAVSTEDLRLRWPTDSGASIAATEEILDALTELRRLKSEAKDLEELIDRRQGDVQRFMADAATLVGPDGEPVATWKTQAARRIDVKALRAKLPTVAAEFTSESTSRVFRLK